MFGVRSRLEQRWHRCAAAAAGSKIAPDAFGVVGSHPLTASPSSSVSAVHNLGGGCKMGLTCAALSRPACSSAGLQGTPGWRRLSRHQAARRGAGLTAARSRGMAVATAAAGSGDRAAALQRICTLERLNLELSLGRPVSEPELSAFAAGCMDAGMSESGVSGLLMKYPKAFHLDHSALAPKLAIVRGFMEGHMEGEGAWAGWESNCSIRARCPSAGNVVWSGSGLLHAE